MKLWPLLSVVACCFIVSDVTAAPVIRLPDVELRIGEIKSFQIDVVGGDAVQGLNFYLQIGDGGAVLGGTDTAPIVSDVDLISGTIFDGNNTGQTRSLIEPLVHGHNITTTAAPPETVAAFGTLATITLDGRSLTLADAGKQINYQLGIPSIGATTDFAGVAATLEGTGGTFSTITITAIPEPTGVAFLALAGSVVALRRRRRR